MTIRLCFVTILIGVSAGQPAAGPPPRDQDVLLSTPQALVGVDRLAVVLAVRATEQDDRRLDTAKLKAQIAAKLDAAGIRREEGEAELVSRLVVRIESTPVPEGGKYVGRIQLALVRLVTLPGPPGRQIPAEVWQCRPAIEMVAEEALAEAIGTAVARQTDSFLDAWKRARSLPTPPQNAGQGNSTPSETRPTPPPAGNPPAAGYLFVSSRNSSVFHRPDCRWAQDIASGNLVGYKSREEAVQAGKRPCKTCKP